MPLPINQTAPSRFSILNAASAIVNPNSPSKTTTVDSNVHTGGALPVQVGETLSVHPSLLFDPSSTTNSSSNPKSTSQPTSLVPNIAPSPSKSSNLQILKLVGPTIGPIPEPDFQPSQQPNQWPALVAQTPSSPFITCSTSATVSSAAPATVSSSAPATVSLAAVSPSAVPPATTISLRSPPPATSKSPPPPPLLSSPILPTDVEDFFTDLASPTSDSAPPITYDVEAHNKIPLTIKKQD